VAVSLKAPELAMERLNTEERLSPATEAWNSSAAAPRGQTAGVAHGRKREHCLVPIDAELLSNRSRNTVLRSAPLISRCSAYHNVDEKERA
jgi:hypothetical protein